MSIFSPEGGRPADRGPNWERLDEELRRSRRGPLRRLAIFASGVDKKLLMQVVAEETSYARLGTFVILTSFMAGLGSFIASGFYLHPPVINGSGVESIAQASQPLFPVTPLTLSMGVGTALFIFIFDRALVGAPLNSYQYPPEVLEALWNPAADSKWFAALNDALTKPSIAARSRQLWSVLLAGFLRVLVSLCISFLVADAILFVVFKSEIDARVSAIRVQSADSARTQETQIYKRTISNLNAQLAALTVAGDPTVASLNTNIGKARTDIANATADVSALKDLEVKEIYNGSVQCVELSTSQQVCTSGKVGRGPAAAAIVSALGQRYGALRGARNTLRTLEGQRSAALKAARRREKGNTSRIQQIKTELANVQSAHIHALQQLSGEATDTTGILVRHQAVASLEADTNPSTVQVDPLPPCPRSPLLNWGCHTLRIVWPGTPMGTFVVALRLLLIAIDLMPIVIKIQFSLRRRRAYDALRAALEERYVASAINIVDARLVAIGEKMERRASERKFERSGSGANLILKAQGVIRAARPGRFMPRRSSLSNLLDTLNRGVGANDSDYIDPRLRPKPKVATTDRVNGEARLNGSESSERIWIDFDIGTGRDVHSDHEQRGRAGEKPGEPTPEAASE